MSRCTICSHPRREAIDLDLVNQKSFRYIAERYGATIASLHRHRQAHLGRDLAGLSAGDRRARLAEAIEARRAETIARAADLFEHIESVLAGVRKLFDACDAWLLDPDNPARYDLSPRAEEILVRYTAVGPAGRPVSARARLSALLGALEGQPLDPALPSPAAEERPVDGSGPAPRPLRRDAVLSITSITLRAADPRELLLKTARRLEIEAQMLHRLLAQLADAEVAPAPAEIDIIGHPDWVRFRTVLVNTLGDYPEARFALVRALGEAVAEDARHSNISPDRYGLAEAPATA